MEDLGRRRPFERCSRRPPREGGEPGAALTNFIAATSACFGVSSPSSALTGERPRHARVYITLWDGGD